MLRFLFNGIVSVGHLASRSNMMETSIAIDFEFIIEMVGNEAVLVDL